MSPAQCGYFPSLRALAIKDEKIYVVEKPEIPQLSTQMYLDVEGIPDQDFYYLIGLVITDEISVKNFSFWANNRDEEEKIWNKFVSLIKSYRDFTLFHYGSYETKFIEKMSKKYGRKEDEEIINKISSNLVNALSLIYANIYFPTYSNSLKDIGVYIGEKWSEENATGLQSLVWRHNWSETNDGILKEKLITYNMEDCFVLKKVIEAIGNISTQPKGSISNVASTNDLKPKSLYNFQRNHFIFDDLDFVNKAAYFDYQREKVFFRDKKKVVKQKSIGIITGNKKYRINKHIEIALPRKCYKCGSIKIKKHDRYSKVVLDLNYFNYGVKRWVVKYSTSRVKCETCEATFMPKKYKEIKSKHGYQLHVWVIYQIVVLRQSYTRIEENLRGVFGLYFKYDLFTRFKTKISKLYNQWF